MNTKKIISVLLVVVMLIGMIPIINVSAEQDSELWTSYADLSWFTEGGGVTTSTDPADGKHVKVGDLYYKVDTTNEGKTFTIDTAEKLAGVALLTNLMNTVGEKKGFQSSTFKITADIDLSAHLWVPIGGVAQFKANMQGAKTNGTRAVISGMRIDQTTTAAALSEAQKCTAFIGYFAAAELKNLEISNSTIASDGGYTAAFVAKEIGWTKYTNLCVSASTEITMLEDEIDVSNSAIGGILGYSDGNSDAWADTFTNCVFSGNINASNNIYSIGGILGQCLGVTKLEGCIVNGSITAAAYDGTTEGFRWGGVGGLIGHIYGNSTTAVKPTINKCYVSAEISAYKNVGGFIGLLDTQSRNEVSVNVTDTQFDGTIYASTTDCIGAFVGRAFPGASGTTPTFNFTRVLSTGIATLINGGSIKYVLVHNTNNDQNLNARYVFNDCYALFACDLLNIGSQVTQYIGGEEVVDDANVARVMPKGFDPNTEKSVWARVDGVDYPVLTIAKDYINENSAATTADAPTTAWTDAGNYDLSWIVGYDEKPETGTYVEVDGKWYQTEGYTAGTEFIISDAAHLAGLSKLLTGGAGKAFENCTFKVNKNIDLSAHKWTPIGTQTSGASVFYGSMTGATGSNGTGSAVITGMYIDSTVSGSVNYTAGMFATFRGPRLANLELKNATVKAIDGPTGSFVGMVDTVSEFVNLKSDATMIYAPTVKSSSWQGVGGIVGKTSNNTGVTFDGCVFTGDISSTNAYTNSAGGIVSITIGKVTVKNSIVTADITTSTTASGHSADWSGYGGIIGLTREGSLNSITIDSCYVSSTIKGYYRVGGIVGNLYATYNVNDGTGIKCDASIKNTQFDGVVMVGSNTEEGGGLIATKRFATSGTGVDLALENVVNTGKITDASGNARTFVKSGCTTNDHAHIWVARDWTGTTIKDCYDTQAHLIAHMGTEILATIIPATLGLNTWTVRDSYPVLTVAKDVASKKYVDVDLSWFEPNNTGTLANVKTQRQVGGLIRLIEACGCNNGTKFTTKYASMIKVSKAFEGVIADFTTDEYVKTTFANCVYASEEAVISHIYAQSSTLPSEGTNKYNIRFVAEIENLNHEQAGFDFYITYTDKTTGNTVYSNLNSVTGLTTAYSSIKAGGETRTPDGEGWFVVFTFTNLDVSIGNDIKITAVANVGDIVKGTNIDRYSKVGQWNVASDGTLSQAS